jgi:HK97 family phage portal protein
MKLKLPIIGSVLTGTDTADIVKTKFLAGVDVLGGLLQFAPNTLSSEKSISTKILQANKGWVYRNNDTIAQEVSKMEFELYTVGLSAGEIVYNEVQSHPLLDLLDKPNAETVKSDALYIIQSHKKLSGDAFWLKIRNGAQIIGLRSLPPDKIILNLQPPTPEDPTVIMSYHYQDVIDGKKIDVVYDPKDIIHFKKPNPSNPFRGYGAVEALADTIDLDNLTTETTLNFFKNGAINNFVLSTDNKVTDDQLKRLRAEMRASYGGASNAYKTMILGGGLKPVDISFSNKDQEFLGQLAWYRDKIMIGFGNTKASMGMVDDVNRASYEGSIIGWQRNTVKPDMEAIVNTLNEFLVPEFGQNLVLGFVDPVPEDRSDDVAEAKDLYPAGVLTLNEARELVGLDEMEDGTGDEVYQKPAPIISDPSQSGNANPANEDPKNPKPDNGGNE